jgi:hypothetical protein
VASRQPPPSNASGSPDDSAERFIRHEVCTIISEASDEAIDKKLADHAAKLGLELDDGYLIRRRKAIALLIGRRIFEELTDQQKTELESLLQRHDYLSALQLLEENVATIAKIVEEELALACEQLDKLAFQKLQEDAKSNKRMEFNAEQIIEKALAAGIRPDEPMHPEPDTRAELRVTALEAANLESVLAELRERKMPLSTAEAEATIAGLNEISERTARVARELGLHSIERQLLSQNKLADMLGVSQMSVSRWYRNPQASPPESQ